MYTNRWSGFHKCLMGVVNAPKKEVTNGDSTVSLIHDVHTAEYLYLLLYDNNWCYKLTSGILKTAIV